MSNIENIPILFEEILEIKRCYPNKKQKKIYPLRFNNFVFEKFNEMIIDEKLQNDYKKWKNGINYNTNRKITIGGKIHTSLKQQFMIKYGSFKGGFKNILFTSLIGIDSIKYICDTEKFKNDIDIENNIIDDYNNNIDDTIKKIQELKKWNDFIEFEGIKYGIKRIYNNIHRENDCNGEIIEYYKCRSCRGTSSFYEQCRCEYKENIKCLKCGYKE
jgi:hypothetical protein